jgi:GH43 family beta-xylosidase
MYGISSTEPDAGYSQAAEIALPGDKWAIDGLPFSYQDKRYFVWSGWQGDEDVQQDIFIALMDENGVAQGPRVALGSPDQSWENIADETPSINEGPQPVIDPAGQLHVVYSANGSWGPNYCLADLRLRTGGDPLDASAWSESDGCLFGANAATLAAGARLAEKAKGVGHHSFILPGEDLAETDEGSLPFLYHGVPADEEPSNFWAARKWFIGEYEWVPDVLYGTGAAADAGWSLRFSE